MEGLTYTDAMNVLEEVRSRIGNVAKINPSDVAPAKRETEFDTALAQLHFDIDKICGCDFYRKKYLANQTTSL